METSDFNLFLRRQDREIDAFELQQILTTATKKGNATKVILLLFSINLLVFYRESVNLIGCITRRLSAVSINLLVVYRESDWLHYS